MNRCTVGDLKKFLKENNIPDDAEIEVVEVYSLGYSMCASWIEGNVDSIVGNISYYDFTKNPLVNTNPDHPAYNKKRISFGSGV